MAKVLVDKEKIDEIENLSKKVISKDDLKLSNGYIDAYEKASKKEEGE